MILEAVLLVQFMVKIKVIYVNMREKYHTQLQNILSAILHTCLLLLITIQEVKQSVCGTGIFFDFELEFDSSCHSVPIRNYTKPANYI